MASELTINDLTDEAQHAAIESFAKFYIKKFDQGNLDVLAQIDESGHIADINQWLLDNKGFLHEERLSGLIKARGANMKALLAVLKTPFNANGIPDTPWDEWEDKQVEKFPQGR